MGCNGARLKQELTASHLEDKEASCLLYPKHRTGRYEAQSKPQSWSGETVGRPLSRRPRLGTEEMSPVQDRLLGPNLEKHRASFKGRHNGRLVITERREPCGRSCNSEAINRTSWLSNRHSSLCGLRRGGTYHCRTRRGGTGLVQQLRCHLAVRCTCHVGCVCLHAGGRLEILRRFPSVLDVGGSP